MSYARRQHPNAPFTPEGRRRMVDCVLVDQWTVEATAERFQVDAKTVRKWVKRFLAEGPAGLFDRSSCPKSSPKRTPRPVREQVIRLRKQRRKGAAWIAHQVGLSASTVQNILNQAGLGRLDRGDRASADEPVRRYQRDRPGELIHVDIKKFAAIPDGGGWRIHGRGHDSHGGHSGVGYVYVHSAVDDRTRIAYSEIHRDEQGTTAAGFWTRAAAFYASLGIDCERVITDNGPCYQSQAWHQACADTNTKVNKTRPYRPQTNGKAERFHRILIEEWAYIRSWTSEHQRAATLTGFLHFYNHHRPHGALGWATPTDIIRDNLPAPHS